MKRVLRICAWIAVGAVLTYEIQWLIGGIADAPKRRALIDIVAIEDSITAFRDHNARLPTKAEFEQLHLRRVGEPGASGEIVPNGSIGEMRDPFGRPYFYSRLADSDGFLLKSFGRDRKDSDDDYVWHSE